MTVAQLIRQAADRLTAHRIESGYLDALVLFGELRGLSKDRALACLPEESSPTEATAYQDLVDQRALGKPLAYLQGRKEFYGLDFAVGPGVLVPRPETEVLVDWVLGTHPSEALRLRDLCTGSGCIPISLKAHRSHWTIEGSDLSPTALGYARRNAASLVDSTVTFFEADLLVETPPNRYTIITANPPYVAQAEAQANQDAGWQEPLLAFDGGPDGLTIAEQIIDQAWAALVGGGWLYLEIGHDQTEPILDRLAQQGYVDTAIQADLAGIGRVARGRKP